MSIIYRKGDLLAGPEKYLINGCNAQGVMGSGIALQIKRKWPEAYEYYKYAYVNGGLELGTILTVDCDDKLVIHCITQEFYGGDSNRVYVDYCAVKNYLRFVNHNFKQHSIAMPKIGCGLANGDWNIIEQIINETMVDCQPIVYTL